MNMHYIPHKLSTGVEFRASFLNLLPSLRVCSDLGTWFIAAGVLLALATVFPAKGTFCQRYHIEKTKLPCALTSSSHSRQSIRHGGKCYFVIYLLVVITQENPLKCVFKNIYLKCLTVIHYAQKKEANLNLDYRCVTEPSVLLPIQGGSAQDTNQSQEMYPPTGTSGQCSGSCMRHVITQVCVVTSHTQPCMRSGRLSREREPAS